MNMRYRLVRQLADGRFHSGESLAATFGVTRAAVWKHLQQVPETLALDVHAVRGRGYRLARPIELLDESQILEGLSPLARSRLASLEICASVDSTNDHLLRCARHGAPAGTVCLAEQQTAGRGRRGREWISPFGSNIYLSILWQYAVPPQQLSGLSLVAGLAVVRALTGLGITGIGLKWPNDVLWQGKKLAGLLLEVSGESEGPSQIVLGLGLNTRLSERQAESIDQPWVDLASISGASVVSRNRLAAALLEHQLEALSSFCEQGLACSLDDWHRYDLYYGQEVQLRMGDRTVEGVHRGIDNSGALLLACGGEVRAFHAGEVSLRSND